MKCNDAVNRVHYLHSCTICSNDVRNKIHIGNHTKCLKRVFSISQNKNASSFHLTFAKPNNFLRSTTYFEETRRFVAGKILLRYIYRAEIFHRKQISLQSWRVERFVVIGREKDGGGGHVELNSSILSYRNGDTNSNEHSINFVIDVASSREWYGELRSSQWVYRWTFN